MSLLELLPDTAAVEQGELTIGGVRASALAEELGTPVVVYCERTVLACARAYREAAPDALVLYGAKAFPNVALLRLLATEGLGADVSTLGELVSAQRAGVPGERMVVHGNNKSDDELRAAAEAGARFVVLDALDEVERAAAAGVKAVLVRVTPGIEADTHPAIRTPRFAPPTTARSSGFHLSRRGRRSPRPVPPASTSWGYTSTSALSSSTRRRRARALTGSAASRPSAGPSSAGRRRSSTSAGGSGSSTTRANGRRRSPSSSRRCWSGSSMPGTCTAWNSRR